MLESVWEDVDTFFADRLLGTDAVLDAALASSAAAGLPDHHVSPTQGKLLFLLARVAGARSILEVGTLAGYSTIWLARALPEDGSLISLEAEATHAEVARTNLARAGLGERVEVRIGAALGSLRALVAAKHPPFDLIFIDADKPNNPAYLEWALRLSRPGTLILADNVVRGGAVADAASSDPRVVGVRRFLEQLGADPRVSATAIQTVGSKGFDGFALARVERVA